MDVNNQMNNMMGMMGNSMGMGMADMMNPMMNFMNMQQQQVQLFDPSKKCIFFCIFPLIKKRYMGTLVVLLILRGEEEY